jgi:hypothetical protein
VCWPSQAQLVLDCAPAPHAAAAAWHVLICCSHTAACRQPPKAHTAPSTIAAAAARVLLPACRQPPYAVLSRRRRARHLGPCASCNCRSVARASSSPCSTGSLSSLRLMMACVGSKSPSWLACGWLCEVGSVGACGDTTVSVWLAGSMLSCCWKVKW